MPALDRIPPSLRRQARRTLQPARETRLHLEEARGLRFGARMAGANDAVEQAPANGHRPNRLERYFDNHAAGEGIQKWRHYFEIYDRHFAKFVGSEVYVVEIGVAAGGSLQMWLDYFGPCCHLYGIDIAPGCKMHERESVRICIGDQADPRFWTWFLREVPRIDILIDDGGHRLHQQVATFEAVYPHIRPGGVYLCEDVHGTDNPFHGYVNGLARNLHSWERFPTTEFQRLVGSVHVYPYVTVIEKPDQPLLEFRAQRHGTEWNSGKVN